MSERTCTIAGCDKPHRAKGLCVAHYSELRRASTDDESPRCSIPDCDKPAFTKAGGMCQKHWTRVQRHGSPEVLKVGPRSDPAHLFWAKVEQSGDCWVWVGVIKWNGYGSFHYRSDAPTYIAHRFAYEDMVGPIPEGLELDHLCRNRACVNPYHLEPVTRVVNNLRSNSASALNARKTHCIRGHEFTAANTRMVTKRSRSRAARSCRACERMRAAKADMRIAA